MSTQGQVSLGHWCKDHWHGAQEENEKWGVSESGGSKEVEEWSQWEKINKNWRESAVVGTHDIWISGFGNG